MRSSSDPKTAPLPVVLPRLQASNSLSLSTPRVPDAPIIAVTASLPPPPPPPSQPQQQRIGLRSMLTSASLNQFTSSSQQHAGEPHDDPLLTALAQSDLNVVRSVAENYYSQYKNSVAENAQLRTAMQQLEADSIQVVHFLEDKLKEMQTEMTAYKDGMTQLLEDHRSAEEALQVKYGDMIRERDIELARYATVTAKLHADLQQASRYVQQRQEHAAELQQLQQQLSELGASHKRELASLHFQTVDRKLKLLALEKAMRAEFNSLVEARAAKALEERFQSVLERARNLESEKLLLTHNLQDLMQLTTQLDAERLQIRREAAVQQQAQKELKNHALARGRLKEQADFKVHQLEERLREVTGRHKQQLAETESRYEARIASLEEELKTTRNSLQSHRKELQQMRQLTAKVVGERSELENFFHTALADCQRYQQAMGTAAGSVTNNNTTTVAAAPPVLTSSSGAMLTEKVDWGSSGGAVSSSGNAVALATSMLPGPVSSAAPRKNNNGAYFEELSWKEKEKVIKSLLFFLNANYYKSSSVPESGPAE